MSFLAGQGKVARSLLRSRRKYRLLFGGTTAFGVQMPVNTIFAKGNKIMEFSMCVGYIFLPYFVFVLVDAKFGRVWTQFVNRCFSLNIKINDSLQLIFQFFGTTSSYGF